MSQLPTITSTTIYTTMSVSMANRFTEITNYTTTVTDTVSYTQHDHSMPSSRPTPTNVTVEDDVSVIVVLQVPLTCNNLRDYYRGRWTEHILGSKNIIDDLKPNPDIAGAGTWAAFFATACLVVLLTLVAYIGGFLPGHHLRRVDKRIFRANSRNQNSHWRKVIEGVMISLSDQQLVTGLAILIAGFHEMMMNNLALYHWQIVVYLAWLSSSVHIASLTVLRDAFNRNPTLRNLRVVGMLVILVLLLAALWPLRFGADASPIPAKCFWTSFPMLEEQNQIDPNWLITVGVLVFAYLWKLSQLFVTFRGVVRRWLVARPEAAVERLLRRTVLSHRSRWLTWPICKILTICYLTFATYAELAESFVATIFYLCLTLSYGLVLVVIQRKSPDSDDVVAGERRLTFGQLVPVLLLILPILLIFELSAEPDPRPKTPDAIYSLVQSGLLRPKNPSYRDLTSALHLNEPSKFEDKMQNGQSGSYDPLVDHLMSSHVFQGMIWSFFVALVGVGLAVMVTTSIGGESVAMRWYVLMYGGLPAIALVVPLTALFGLPFSRRLR